VNRAQLMLVVLRDGKPHTRRDIFERVGFQLTNNSASELRAKGYDVRQSRERVDGVNVYSYQLHGSLSERGKVEGGSPLTRARASLMPRSESEHGSLNESGCSEGPTLAVTGGVTDAPDSLSEPLSEGESTTRVGCLDRTAETFASAPVACPSPSESDSLPEPALTASPPGRKHDPGDGRAGSESEWTCRCGSSEYRHVTDDIFRCNGCNARADIFSRQLPLGGVA
jgi:hypothetical protein